MRTKFDLAQWAMTNLPLAIAGLLLAALLGYLLKQIWTENIGLRDARDVVLRAHAAEIKELQLAHALAIQSKTTEIKELTDRYHSMAERNISVLDSLDRTIDHASALPYLQGALPAIQTAINSIGAELGLKPHQLR
jgi:hypothetical protein